MNIWRREIPPTSLARLLYINSSTSVFSEAALSVGWVVKARAHRNALARISRAFETESLERFDPFNLEDVVGVRNPR
jgi:hypothetical protein